MIKVGSRVKVIMDTLNVYTGYTGIVYSMPGYTALVFVDLTNGICNAFYPWQLKELPMHPNACGLCYDTITTNADRVCCECRKSQCSR